MNTNKLVKAIQILIKEELKQVLPKLVKEAVKVETKSLVNENKRLNKILKTKSVSSNTFLDFDVNDDVYASKEQKQYTKNPVLNQILNETADSPYAAASTEENSKTISFDSNMAMGGVEAMRAQMAAKMGYGDMAIGTSPNGLGVQTGNEALDKAFNRDYTQLVKRFKR